MHINAVHLRFPKEHWYVVGTVLQDDGEPYNTIIASGYSFDRAALLKEELDAAGNTTCTYTVLHADACTGIS